MARCIVVFAGVVSFCVLLAFTFLHRGQSIYRWTAGEYSHSHEYNPPYYGQAVDEWSKLSRIYPRKMQRLVIIGAGPTALGTAHRLYELGILRANTQVVILEAQSKPGGLAVSQRDQNGFLWDMGGHVVFSHYKYFDDVLDKAVANWTQHKRAAFAFMKGSSGKSKFIPYPVQENILAMDVLEQEKILKEIQQLHDHPIKERPKNFDDWLLHSFGKEFCEIFMRKYNRKIWTVDPKEMNFVWVGDRVAVPSIEKIKANFARVNDSEWGPNRIFRFPKCDGTGGIWQSVAELLPKGWFHFEHKVTEVNIKQKTLNVTINSSKDCYNLKYDLLISTAPLDVLVNMDKSNYFAEKKKLSSTLVYTRTHIVGVGLSGEPPKYLADKSWMYFPDSYSPFYRVTVFSRYSDDHVPDPKKFWSLMCESAEPKHARDQSNWSKDVIVNSTISALVEYSFISANQVVSKWHHRLDHGYPVPSMQRERILAGLQGWLQSRGIFSRGRFGGWRYEVGNQDHSLMQGVEVVDLLLRGIPEETYQNPNLVNSMKGSNRAVEPLQISSMTPDYEIAVAHYDEELDWLLHEARHCYIYHKGTSNTPDLRFKQWNKLPNVGRESHTYLYHIVSNYNHLANITLFIQGSIKEHKLHTYSNIKDYIREANFTSYSVKVHEYFDGWGRVKYIGKWSKELRGGEIRKSKYTVGEFWEKAFGTPHPSSTEWNPAAFFAVTRERILKRPRKFYAHLMSFVDDHPNPEEGHFFERTWHGVFFGY